MVERDARAELVRIDLPASAGHGVGVADGQPGERVLEAGHERTGLVDDPSSRHRRGPFRDAPVQLVARNVEGEEPVAVTAGSEAVGLEELALRPPAGRNLEGAHDADEIVLPDSTRRAGIDPGEPAVQRGPPVERRLPQAQGGCAAPKEYLPGASTTPWRSART